MARKKPTERLAAGEINILRLLWDLGASTLSAAHAEMVRRGEQVGYTTVQTRLERLVAKNVVTKTSDRPAKYQAAIAPDDVSGPLLDLLLERVSGAVPLFAQLIQDPALTSADLAEMKRLIAEAERNREPEAPKPEKKR
ncbi:Penicillinase repressor [Anatilimnocola aggregata]|uniref:Penicillinase repressor n=1 Tax=Anatilimnocola aggregata TaxID=2528021 RepID=A0A517YJQ2_9BACT|nr:BlaI/MecI/CopY family transcriptional regulator [Anatilimnocola aggregata]QDU30453.1 Penicillinase repressor [Anatilimnocola aggregata]